MPSLIDEDQTGFISNRQTHDNIRRALNIIDQISKGTQSAVLLSLDAEKAFDSVGWDFLFQVMEIFGFSDSLYNSLYSSPTARIKVNGSLSNQRGCRQGCPLSPLPFNFCIEPLAHQRGVCSGGYRWGKYREHFSICGRHPCHNENPEFLARFLLEEPDKIFYYP